MGKSKSITGHRIRITCTYELENRLCLAVDFAPKVIQFLIRPRRRDGGALNGSALSMPSLSSERLKR